MIYSYVLPEGNLVSTHEMLALDPSISDDFLK